MTAKSEVLDVLIVGGGPGGTAAAFRAKELGLKALVVEYDDLMKRIRDYSKDKLILPGFGGGDKMKFPAAGSMVSSLCFDPIDKDEMCGEWKGLYHRFDIAKRVGVELTGLERRPDGIYEAQAWDHTERKDAAFLARHVVLAIGRGVPRRFDIPGNTDGIAFRLKDPRQYVGRPACVIGGGTSAAEAVIALSCAKAEAGDPAAVYWSYRGDKMPRVSKALAEVFFGAYVGNGNVRYYPNSEPAAVVTGGDRKEYLAVRVDRRRMEGRPSETSHLEFPKESCIACIGEEIPEALLAGMGIRMAVGGPRRRKRIVVNRFLESEQPNVYLIGDILSQAHFETEDFGADPDGFREVKHRGNIKSALRDGVLVAQVIQQRLEGRRDIDLEVPDAEHTETEARGREVVAVTRPVDASGPPLESVAPDRLAGDAIAFLIRVLPGGIQGEEYPVTPNAVTTLGRSDCDITFDNDTLLSDRHASISHSDDGCFLRDDSSSTGVFLQVPATRKISVGDGDLLRLGRQFLRFSVFGDDYAFTHFDAQGREVGRYPLSSKSVILGRQAPDVTLDAGDTTLSRRHLAVSVSDGRILIKDLKSANGSYLKVRTATPLEHGDQFRVGQQLFTLSLHDDAVLDTGYIPTIPDSTESPPPPEPAAVPAGADGPSVTFEGLGKTVPVAPGQTLCEAAEAHGVSITAECHSGICGSDPIRILSGHENIDGGPSDGEAETLEDLCGLEPGPCRLACMVKLKGR